MIISALSILFLSIFANTSALGGGGGGGEGSYVMHWEIKLYGMPLWKFHY